MLVLVKCRECGEEVEVNFDGDNASICPSCRSVDCFDEVEEEAEADEAEAKVLGSEQFEKAKSFLDAAYEDGDGETSLGKLLEEVLTDEVPTGELQDWVTFCSFLAEIEESVSAMGGYHPYQKKMLTENGTLALAEKWLTFRGFKTVPIAKPPSLNTNDIQITAYELDGYKLLAVTDAYWKSTGETFTEKELEQLTNNHYGFAQDHVTHDRS